MQEIQLAHEKDESAYAVYVMDDEDGCVFSDYYPYGDTAGRLIAKTQAEKTFNRLCRENPKAESYSDA